MTILADLLSAVFERRLTRVRRGPPDERPLPELTAELISATGEVSGQAVATSILDRFTLLEYKDKCSFFKHLLTDLDIQPSSVRNTLKAWEADRSRDNYQAFMMAAEPPRQELIRRLNQVPGATGALVAMRADLLRLAKDQPEFQALDLDFKHLFTSWFNRGFLVLRPINWQSPAHILEKIIAYEAVHAIGSWDDLRRRLEPDDRRCFAFFHPSMPDEPLIFVEVALTQGIPNSIQTLLSEDLESLSPDTADTAVFYSISNCQSGLAGISFGNSLIKQVAADLASENPSLKHFVTLSPIPGLVNWLNGSDIKLDRGDAQHIRQLTAHYLVNVKRGGQYPFDPVARFHLGNGALIHQIHTNADTGEKGLSQSLGAMVSYLYDLESVSRNHEMFAAKQKVVVSEQVKSLASSAQKLLTSEAP